MRTNARTRTHAHARARARTRAHTHKDAGGLRSRRASLAAHTRVLGARNRSLVFCCVFCWLFCCGTLHSAALHSPTCARLLSGGPSSRTRCSLHPPFPRSIRSFIPRSFHPFIPASLALVASPSFRAASRGRYTRIVASLE
jgi:hypothetical protein